MGGESRPAACRCGAEAGMGRAFLTLACAAFCADRYQEVTPRPEGAQAQRQGTSAVAPRRAHEASISGGAKAWRGRGAGVRCVEADSSIASEEAATTWGARNTNPRRRTLLWPVSRAVDDPPLSGAFQRQPCGVYLTPLARSMCRCSRWCDMTRALDEGARTSVEQCKDAALGGSGRGGSHGRTYSDMSRQVAIYTCNVQSPPMQVPPQTGRGFTKKKSDITAAHEQIMWAMRNRCGLLRLTSANLGSSVQYCCLTLHRGLSSAGRPANDRQMTVRCS